MKKVNDLALAPMCALVLLLGSCYEGDAWRRDREGFVVESETSIALDTQTGEVRDDIVAYEFGSEETLEGALGFRIEVSYLAETALLMIFATKNGWNGNNYVTFNNCTVGDTGVVWLWGDILYISDGQNTWTQPAMPAIDDFEGIVYLWQYTPVTFDIVDVRIFYGDGAYDVAARDGITLD